MSRYQPPPEMIIIKIVILLVIIAVVIQLSSCSSSLLDVDKICKVTCEDCKKLTVDCTDKKDKDVTEVKPNG